jgi:aspartyl-tRNA(Asn)/glutamyl-tRNA(Gln) amidotransferase subunit A
MPQHSPRLIRTKQVSPVEALQAHLDRNAAVNPKVNAITTLLAERAMQAAKAAERAVVEDKELGIFHGVPFSIKDVIDVAGIVTHGGSSCWRTMSPERMLRRSRA